MTERKSTGKHISKPRKPSKRDQLILEQTMKYEKEIYDLKQLLDIAKSFCSTLDFKNLLESIVYICMAQMHVLGAEIFVRDLITNENFLLETSRDEIDSRKLAIPIVSPITEKLLELQKPVTMEELRSAILKDKKNTDYLSVLESLSPTLIVPLMQNGHLNGILVLQERIAIEDDTSYTDYEEKQIMSIGTLASVAINNASLLEMSSTDMMTHLKLKFYFFNQLTQALDAVLLNPESESVERSNIGVLMFDIDFFKKFNDTYGHECGDFVLITVADLIKKSLRDTDIASRYGGEEFTVLLRGAGKEEAMLVAERIRSTIERYDFVYEKQHFHVTISGGVSVFDPVNNPVDTPNRFVYQADMGLYMSKRAGRNRVSFYEPSEHKFKPEDHKPDSADFPEL